MKKENVNKMIYPRFHIFAIYVLMITGLLIYSLLSMDKKNPIAYVIYALSTYGFILVCVRLYVLIKKFNNRKNDIYQKNALLKRYMTDTHFKIHVSLYVSFGLNLIYTLLKFGTGIYYQSFWFMTLAVYYFSLAIMRFLLLHYMQNHALGDSQLKEAKKYRMCGMIIGLMTIALSGEVALIVKNNQGFEYAGYLIYVVALYDFYNMISAFINVFKYRRMNNSIMSATKIISLISALVSILSLETAMLTQFGKADELQLRQLMTGITGMCVCFIVLCISIYMIVVANRKIKDL